MILFHPHQRDGAYSDDRSEEVMVKTIEFFESKGIARIMSE